MIDNFDFEIFEGGALYLDGEKIMDVTFGVEVKIQEDFVISNLKMVSEELCPDQNILSI